MSQPATGNPVPMARETVPTAGASIAVAPKTFKRRASKACSFCQWRKIRCNVEDRHPCSNCVLESIDCAITKTRQSKKSKLDHPVQASNPVQASESANAVANTAEQARSVPNGNGSHVQQVEPRSPENAIPVHRVLHSHDPEEVAASFPIHYPDEIVQAPSLNLTPSVNSGTSPQGTSDGMIKTSSSLETVSLPEFLEPVPSHLPPEDIEYLHKKGCFDIPAPKFRDAILRCYSEFSHPYMPLLDLGRFLYAITDPSPNTSRISLLLFQAVMFAGTRKALFIKTKALYDMEYEKNRMAVIQALGLMSYWYETPDDQKNACHWLRIALYLSEREGLNRNPATMDIPEYERRMRRRIWWSYIMRDPLCALGLKAPLSHYPRDHDVPEMTIEDYDLGDVPLPGFNKVGVRWPPGKRRLLCLSSISHAQLNKHLYSVLSQQYKLGDYRRRAGKSDGKSSKMVLLPLTTEAARSRIDQLESSLESWRASLPSELRTTTVGSEISDSGFEPFIVIRTVLHLVYHTSLITLYRPWLRQSQPEDAFQSKVRSTVRRSAQSITELSVELHRLDLVRHLPQTGISALVAAVVSHISDMLSNEEPIQKAGVRRFEQCSHLLNELRENYYAADFSADFVRLLAQARKLSQKSSTGETRLAMPETDLEDQVSAQSRFNSVIDNPNDGKRVAEVTRPLPEALFPEGTSLSYDSVALQESIGWDVPLEQRGVVEGAVEGAQHMFSFQQDNLEWELPLDFGSALQDAQVSLPGQHADEWDYYRNFRDETVRLLGDFYNDFQPVLPIEVGEEALSTQ
ncbi:hypothetical protein B0A52_01074 [Exophiala mesophila]|uniref:Zn(2)-C6 fungal-type domain-containing protein n=1 Tax=Exophiala mesophila TaxID=212818 RepID=A0A438NGF1_EXOME|nr:hypothetical protein B0A52_01074 [Exophiala mesophila]